MKEFEFEKDIAKIPEVIEFISNCFAEKKITKKNAVRHLLGAEEILETVCQAANDGSKIIVGVGGLFNEVKIRYSARGREITVADIKEKLIYNGNKPLDDRVQVAMESLITKLFGNNLNVRCEKGRIEITQQVKQSTYRGLIITLSALVLGILTGLLLQSFASKEVSGFFTGNIFTPIYSVLMGAIKMIVAPLVFFSIASSIAEFSDLKALGRIAGKISVMYIFTSILAVFTGLLTYKLFPIGDPALAIGVDAEAASSTIAKGEDAVISIKDTLVGIIPTDIITPFQKSDMLQIIFIAVCIGLASATISKSAPVVKEFLSAMNLVVSKITGVIVSFIPLLVFCAMAKMMTTMDLKAFVDVMTWIPTIYIGDLFMIVIYMLLLLILARVNPFKFVSKYYPAMFSAFTLSSSNAALPSSIKQCNKLGISEKIYSFSLPLGATINMDGNCITLMISALFFAKIYQLPMTGTMLLQLFIAIIVLSVGSPGVPGGNLVCLTLLVPQIGVPAEAVSLVIGLYPIIAMMQVMTNVTGDAVVTLIAAKSEKMLDLEKFNE